MMIEILRIERIAVLHETFESSLKKLLPPGYMLYLRQTGRKLPAELESWFSAMNAERLELLEEICAAETEDDIMRISVSPTTRKPSSCHVPDDPVSSQNVKAVNSGYVRLNAGESIKQPLYAQPISALILSEAHLIESHTVSNRPDVPLVSVMPDYVYVKKGKKKDSIGTSAMIKPVAINGGTLGISVSRNYEVYRVVVESTLLDDGASPICSFTGVNRTDESANVFSTSDRSSTIIEMTDGVSCNEMMVSNMGQCSVYSVSVYAKKIPINTIEKSVGPLMAGTVTIISENPNISYILLDASDSVLDTFSGEENRDIPIPENGRLLFTLPAASFTTAHLSLVCNKCTKKPIYLQVNGTDDGEYIITNDTQMTLSGDLIYTLLE